MAVQAAGLIPPPTDRGYVKWTRKIFSATVGDDPDAAALDLGEVRRHGLQEVGGEAQLRPLVLDGGQQRHRDLS